MTRARDAALDAAGILVVDVGNDGTIRDASAASVLLLGVTPTELIGRPLAERLFADHATMAHYQLLRGSGQTVTTVWRWRTSSGELRPLIATWQRSDDGWTGVVTRAAADPAADAQLDALDRAQRHLEDAQRLARLGSFTYELSTGRVGWSSMMYELHDVDPAQPPPTSQAEYMLLLHPDDAGEMMSAARLAIESGEVTQSVYRVRMSDGGWRHLRARMACERREDGTPTILAGSVQDISDDFLQRSELIADRERAQEEASAKTRFLAQVTHELRTPLAGVIGMIDLALGDADHATRADHLASARASARHLLELIDDLLDASREDSWQINVVTIDFDLRDVVAQAMAMVSPRARKKELLLRGDVDERLATARRGDPLRLRQVLVNLLYNGVKYTPRGSVTATVRAGQGDEVVFTVADTGVGIEPDQQAAVFEPFVQAHRDQGGVEGVGLGLAITRELIAAMGGTIGLKSQVGVGTEITFTLRLPIGRGPTTDRLRAIEPGSTPAGAWATAARPLRVLVAEDHPTNAAIAQAILERAGHRPHWVADGEAAVAAEAAQRWDVILMDMEMPRLDGSGAARAIRAREHREGTTRTPIIAVSAHRDAQLNAAAAGMDAYLAKPVDAMQLAELLDRVADGKLTGPIDHAARLSKVGGRAELAAAIADTFLSHQPTLMGEIDGAIAARSAEDLRRAAHGLRGALAMVGATEAAALADALERASLDEAPRLRDRLAAAVARAGAELALR